MFIGHFAVGFASKRFAPRTNLAVLIAATMFLDILWPVFVLLGWERVRIDPGNTRFTPLDFVFYPWSHSLLMSVVWAAAFALVYFYFTRYRAGAAVVAVGVVSHWVLDWISHRADMPLYPGGLRVGLGLWNSIGATLVVELLMFVTGVALYAVTTRALDRRGRYGFWAFVALLLFIYGSDRTGDAPPSVAAVAWIGVFATVLFIPWCWWFDRHRVVRGDTPPIE